jgi:hypothetical protein
MISKNQLESGSTRNSNGMLKCPELIHENTCTTCSLTDEACNSAKTRMDKIKEARILRDAIAPLSPLLIFFPKNPFIKNPINGKSGINATNLIISVFVSVRIVRC